MFPNENAFDGLIAASAAQYGLPSALLKAIIAQESNFVPTAYRAEPAIGDASYGLMQLLSGTAHALGYTGGPAGLYDPATSISLGAAYLAGLVRDAQSGGWGLDSAISAYNGGESADRMGDGKRSTTRADGYLVDGSRLAPFINQGYVNAVRAYMAKYAGAAGPVGLSPVVAAVIGGVGLLLVLTLGGR